MNPSAKLSDLIMALESPSTERLIRFDRETGSIVSVDNSVMNVIEEGDEESPKDLAEWQRDEVDIARAITDDDGSRFIDAPDPFEFHEYEKMERFIDSLENGRAAEELSYAIRGRGAFRHFKDAAYRLGLLDIWYHFRDEAMKEFVVEWAEAKNVPFEDDMEPQKS